MINEDLYRQCLEAVAPRENKRLYKTNSIDLRGTAKLEDEWSRQELISFLKRRTSATVDDISKWVPLKSSVIRSVLNRLVREGKVMSGSDPSASKTLYWLQQNDDYFVPIKRRSKTTRENTPQKDRLTPREKRIAEEKEKTLAAVSTDKWLHANVIAAKAGVPVPIARGHLKRASMAGIVEETKNFHKSYWRLKDG